MKLNLAYYRKKRKMSQEDLAEACSVSRQAISKWELGLTTPNLQDAVILADSLHISLDELVFGTVKTLPAKESANGDTVQEILKIAFRENSEVLITENDYSNLNEEEKQLLKLANITSCIQIPVPFSDWYLGVDNPPTAFIYDVLKILNQMCEYLGYILNHREEDNKKGNQIEKYEEIKLINGSAIYSVDLKTLDIQIDSDFKRIFGFESKIRNANEIKNGLLKHKEFPTEALWQKAREVISEKKPTIIEPLYLVRGKKEYCVRLSICPHISTSEEVDQLFGSITNANNVYLFQMEAK